MSDNEKASWEVLPQEAKQGEVILSKRNDLGILSNFAPTPIEIDGEKYASVEGFWQMMFYPEDENYPVFNGAKFPHKRADVAAMTGFEAKKAGKAAKEILTGLGIEWISYKGKKIYYKGAGRDFHYDLIHRAIFAKVLQNPEVKKKLLSTGDLILRPDHKQPPDKTPAYDYHLILMEIRDKLKKEIETSGLETLAHWSKENRARIVGSVIASLTAEKRAAVFDADGTLWHADIPREFLDFLIKKHALKHFDYSEEDAVGRLFEMCDIEVSICIAQMAYLQTGISIAEMKGYMSEFFETFDDRVFAGQKELISFLAKNGFSVYIVSGGPKWLVDFAAERYFSISSSNVIALQTKIVGGFIGAEVIPPVPFREGKVQAIKKLIPEEILIAAGNSKSDIPMLELAKNLSVTINSFKPEEGTFHFETEQKLIEEAVKRNWVIQSF